MFDVVKISTILWGCAAASPFVLLLVIRWLAERDIIWAIVREGTAKIVVLGGSYYATIVSLKGHYVDQRTGEIVEGDKKNSLLHAIVGVYFIGVIWPLKSIYQYHFEWAEKDREDNIWKRDADTKFVYVIDFPYMIEVKAAETYGNLPVDIEYLLTVKVINPRKALFGVEDWLDRVSGAANRTARNYIGSRSFEDLTSEIEVDKDGQIKKMTTAGDASEGKEEAEYNRFSTGIIALNDRLPDDPKEEEDSSGKPIDKGLRGRYGVVVVSAELLSISISGSAGEEAKKALTTRYVAERKAEAARAEAEGDRDAMQFRADGDVYRISSVYTELAKHGSLGRLLPQLEAMQKGAENGNKTVIWANNPLLQGSSELTELLDDLGVTPVQLKEMVEQLIARGGK